MENIAKIFIVLGLIAVVSGIILWLFGVKLSFLGKLPGDTHMEKENVRFYFPVTTMILLSVLVSLIFMNYP